MYHGSLGAGVAAAASLPFTGLPLIPLLLAGFALIGAGLALKRLTPKLHRS